MSTKYESTERNIKIERSPLTTGAIYIRVSDQKQVDKYSIPTQIKECREYFKKNHIQEVAIFIEEGETAKTSDRTQLKNLLHFVTLNKNKVDYVLVYKLDRWARS